MLGNIKFLFLLFIILYNIFPKKMLKTTEMWVCWGGKGDKRKDFKEDRNEKYAYNYN